MSTELNNSNRWWAKLWTSDLSLSALLVLLMITVFGIYPIAHKQEFGKVLFDLMVAATFSFGIFSITHKIIHRTLAVGFSILLLFAAAVVQNMNNMAADISLMIIIALYFLVLALLLLKRIFSDDNVNLYRIQGAIAVYIIFALIFSFIFRIIFTLNPEAILFKFSPHATIAEIPPFEFMYFSFVILTTMGYGEIIPVGHFAQSMAMVEALAGVLFPSILIARLVGLAANKK